MMIIDRIVVKLRADNDARLIIVAHSSEGEGGGADSLAEERARNTKVYILSHGIAATRLLLRKTIHTDAARSAEPSLHFLLAPYWVTEDFAGIISEAPTQAITPSKRHGLSPELVRSPNSFRDLVERAYEQIKRAHRAHNIPNEMWVGETYKIWLNVRQIPAAGAPVPAARSSVAVPPPGFGASGRREEIPDVREIDVTQSIKARLESDENAFRIKPLDSEVQSILANATTTWRWEVAPLQSGSHELHLLIFMRIRGNDEEETRELASETKVIEVHVHPGSEFLRWAWEWIKNNPEKAVIAPIGALVLWILKKWRDKLKKNKKVGYVP